MTLSNIQGGRQLNVSFPCIELEKGNISESF